ncbi:hypothetical protein BOX15_Mlig000162g9, partial [Macrostomum lignano]
AAAAAAAAAAAGYPARAAPAAGRAGLSAWRPAAAGRLHLQPSPASSSPGACVRHAGRCPDRLLVGCGGRGGCRLQPASGGRCRAQSAAYMYAAAPQPQQMTAATAPTASMFQRGSWISYDPSSAYALFAGAGHPQMLQNPQQQQQQQPQQQPPPPPPPQMYGEAPQPPPQFYYASIDPSAAYQHLGLAVDQQ